jgi:hypothetical protein
VLVELDAGGRPGEHLLQTSPTGLLGGDAICLAGLGAAALARSAAWPGMLPRLTVPVSAISLTVRWRALMA